MKKYLGIKFVHAKPLNRGDYNTYRGWAIPADENPAEDGYLVRYPDGYESWCPKKQFEDANIEIGGQRMEVAIAHLERLWNEPQQEGI